MASVCISNCINDARLPLRPTYINIYKWPESDAEFVKSVSANGALRNLPHPRVVDSISCRQVFLRSYTFSREDDDAEEKTKCLGKVKRRLSQKKREEDEGVEKRSRKKKCGVLRRAQAASSAALGKIFRRLLSCTAKVDVVDR